MSRVVTSQYNFSPAIAIINMSIFFWIWLVVIAACIYKIRIPYHARRIYLAEKLPGPIALPILGNAHLFLNKPLTGKTFVFEYLLTCTLMSSKHAQHEHSLTDLYLICMILHEQ